MDRKLTNFDLFKAALKSFFIQSAWNFERMQALGFTYCISNAIKKIYTDQGLLKDSLIRHLEFFNTNPYLAPTIAGVVLNWEEKHALSKENSIDSSSLKARLMGPFGAIGDSLFWATLRPLTAIVGFILAFIGIKEAPIIFLIIYNIPAFGIRFYGLFKGYQLGPFIIEEIKKFNLNLFMAGMKKFSCFLLGLSLGIYALSPDLQIAKNSLPLNFILCVVLICILILLLRKKMSSISLIYFIVIICIGLKYI